MDPVSPQTRTRVARESWSTRRAFGHWPEMLGTAGRHPGASEPSESRAGHLVDTAGPRNWARFTWDSMSTPWALGPECESPRTVGRHHGPGDTGPGGKYSRSTPRPWDTCQTRPGQLVESAVLRIRAESPVLAGGPHSTTDPILSRPGELVKPTGPRPKHVSPRTAGRHRGPQSVS